MASSTSATRTGGRRGRFWMAAVVALAVAVAPAAAKEWELCIQDPEDDRYKFSLNTRTGEFWLETPQGTETGVCEMTPKNGGYHCLTPKGYDTWVYPDGTGLVEDVPDEIFEDTVPHDGCDPSPTPADIGRPQTVIADIAVAGLATATHLEADGTPRVGGLVLSTDGTERTLHHFDAPVAEDGSPGPAQSTIIERQPLFAPAFGFMENGTAVLAAIDYDFGAWIWLVGPPPWFAVSGPWRIPHAGLAMDVELVHQPQGEVIALVTIYRGGVLRFAVRPGGPPAPRPSLTTIPLGAASTGHLQPTAAQGPTRAQPTTWPPDAIFVGQNSASGLVTAFFGANDNQVPQALTLGPNPGGTIDPQRFLVGEICAATAGARSVVFAPDVHGERVDGFLVDHAGQVWRFDAGAYHVLDDVKFSGLQTGCALVGDLAVISVLLPDEDGATGTLVFRFFAVGGASPVLVGEIQTDVEGNVHEGGFSQAFLNMDGLFTDAPRRSFLAIFGGLFGADADGGVFAASASPASASPGLMALPITLVPPPPEGPWLHAPQLPGHELKVRITAGGSSIAGRLEADCIPETLCFSGALPGRPEAFARVPGPKPNGYLWPTYVKFTTSQVEFWNHQRATGTTTYHLLPAVAAGENRLTLAGLADTRGMLPPLTRLAAAAAPRTAGLPELAPGRELAATGSLPFSEVAPAAGDPPPPAGPWMSSRALPGFRAKVRITAGGGSIDARQEGDCIGETLCASGAIPGRSEVFVRVVGPKPNGRLWPTIVKFSTSQLKVWIEQLASGTVRYYRLEAVAAGDELLTLDGLADKLGFTP